MQAKTRTNQGGSVINFLIVGVILAAIALGAIYFAQQKGKNVATESKPAITSSPSTSPSVSVSPSKPNPESPRPSSQPSSAPVTSPESSPSTVPHTGVMPETGPTSDAALTLLPVLLLTVVSVSYFQSRRATP